MSYTSIYYTYVEVSFAKNWRYKTIKWVFSVYYTLVRMWERICFDICSHYVYWMILSEYVRRIVYIPNIYFLYTTCQIAYMCYIHFLLPRDILDG